MKVLSLVALMISTSIFAANYQNHNISFSISNFGDSGSRVFYSCDSVESEVENLLEELGAKSIRVSCTGGIDVFNPRFSRPAFVRVNFESLTEDSDTLIETNIVKLNIKAAGSNCHLIKQSFRGIENKFITSNVRQRQCRSGYGSQFERTVMTLNVLKEMQ
jgi:hypothetical protein